jgi:hypothetical protein
MAENAMTISIDNLAVSTKAAANTTIGTLTVIDSGGTVRQSNFALTENSAGFFGISGTKLITLGTPIPTGNYCVSVYFNAEYVPLCGDATFVIAVTAT